MDTTELRAGNTGIRNSFLTLTLNCIIRGFGAGFLIALFLACITLLITAGA